MRLLAERDVARLIDRDLVLQSAEDAYRRQSAGNEGTNGRIDLRRSEPKLGSLILAALSESGALAVKTNVHTYADASGVGSPDFRRSTASLLTLWNAARCRPLALISTGLFNRHRTAGGFAVACRALARPEARVLTLFGAGHQAPETIRYLCTVRPIRRVLVVSRSLARAHELVAAMDGWAAAQGIEIAAMGDAAAAAAEADVIACVTSSDRPVFPGTAVRPGTFVILGGANRPGAREADDDLMRRARVYVDDLGACFEKAGDIVLGLASGALKRSEIAGEIGALLDGGSDAPGDADILVFKSIGIAIQDIVLAESLLAKAEADGAGSLFDLVEGTQHRAAEMAI